MLSPRSHSGGEAGDMFIEKLNKQLTLEAKLEYKKSVLKITAIRFNTKFYELFLLPKINFLKKENIL